MKTNVERVLDYLWSAGPQGETNAQIRDATGMKLYGTFIENSGLYFTLIPRRRVSQSETY